MRTKCTALTKIDEDLIGEVDFINQHWGVLRNEIDKKISPLIPFGIIPSGDYSQARSDRNVDPETHQLYTALRVHRWVEGHWLNFLHARRAGVLPVLRYPKKPRRG